MCGDGRHAHELISNAIGKGRHLFEITLYLIQVLLAGQIDFYQNSIYTVLPGKRANFFNSLFFVVKTASIHL